MAFNKLKWLFLLSGVGILIFLIYQIEMDQVLLQLMNIGWIGFVSIIGLYFLAFLLDSVTWTMTILVLPLTWKWVCRTFLVRIVGEAFNNTIPAGGLAGEPVKAILLNSEYDIKYSDAFVDIVKKFLMKDPAQRLGNNI